MLLPQSYSGIPGFKLDLVTVGKMFFYLSSAPASVVDYINTNPGAHMAFNPRLA